MPLVGIAKLAAESPTLEAKSLVEYRDLETRHWISKCDRNRVPFYWTINPYRGCEFACQYCYARYTHEFMDLSPTGDFETKIFAKQWSKSAFVSELRRIPRHESIAIGTATDPYQPAERRYGNTRKILEVLAGESARHIYITTKSDLVRRDISLLTEIHRRNKVGIHVTVTTMDRDLARLIEPKAPRPDLRIEAVRALSEAGIPVSVGASPVLPGINDSEESLEAVAQAAAKAGAWRMHANVLFLKPCSREVFFPFVEKQFPHLMQRYRDTYLHAAFQRGVYPELIQTRVQRLRERYNLMRREDTTYQYEEPQIPLFPQAAA